MGQDFGLPTDLVSTKSEALGANTRDEPCWGVAPCPHLLLPSLALTHSSDGGPQGDTRVHNFHKRHTLMGTPGPEWCVQPQAQDGKDAVGLGPWEEPRPEKGSETTLAEIRDYSQRWRGQASGASRQDIAGPGPGPALLCPDPS